MASDEKYCKNRNSNFNLSICGKLDLYAVYIYEKAWK